MTQPTTSPYWWFATLEHFSPVLIFVGERGQKRQRKRRRSLTVGLSLCESWNDVNFDTSLRKEVRVVPKRRSLGATRGSRSRVMAARPGDQRAAFQSRQRSSTRHPYRATGANFPKRRKVSVFADAPILDRARASRALPVSFICRKLVEGYRMHA